MDDDTRDSRDASSLSHDLYMGTSSYKPAPPRRTKTSGDGVRSYTGANIDTDGFGGGRSLVDEEPNMSLLKPLPGDSRRERRGDRERARLA